MSIQISQRFLKLNKHSLGEQAPIEEIAPETLETSYTQDPIEVVEVKGDTVMHRHFGHPHEHPIAMRHRKSSSDPLHGEEDKLVDEYKDLWDRAKKGECSPNEIKRIKEIQGRLSEINSTRQEDAKRILGEMLETSQDQESFNIGNREKEPKNIPMGRVSNFPIKKALDAVSLVSSKLEKAHHGQPHYPDTDPEHYGTKGTMKTPTIGEAIEKDNAGKKKVYIENEKEAPKGFTVWEGPKGGKYYDENEHLYGRGKRKKRRK